MTPVNTEQRGRIILVTGATGQQGGAAARHLLERGDDVLVRALTRDPGQPDARELERMGAEVIRGDFEDPSTLEAALEGAHGVFSVQNFWTLGAEKEVEYGVRLVDMAKQAGVRHFVYTSVGSADRDTGLIHFETKRQIEDHLRASGLPFTILRPVWFMQNWETPMLKEMIVDGQLAQPLSPETAFQQVDVEDIGGVAALAFSRPDRWEGRTLELGGDDRTIEEVAAAFGRTLGRDVRYVRVSWDDYREAAGEEYAKMYRWFENHGYEADVEAMRAEYPELRTFEDYLERRWSEVRVGV